MVTILYTKGSKSQQQRAQRAIPIEFYCATVEAQCHSRINLPSIFNKSKSKQIFSGLKSKSGIGHKKNRFYKIEILFLTIMNSIMTKTL